jgi:hypothetical protein
VGDVIVTMAEGLRTVIVADACLRSAEAGRTIEIVGQLTGEKDGRVRDALTLNRLLR